MVIGRQSSGSWVSVFNKQKNKFSGLGSKNQPLFTLFIDNLPEGVDQGWLRKTFNNYGVVKDAFIPYKRSKRTSSSLLDIIVTFQQGLQFQNIQWVVG